MWNLNHKYLVLKTTKNVDLIYLDSQQCKICVLQSYQNLTQKDLLKKKVNFLGLGNEKVNSLS